MRSFIFNILLISAVTATSASFADDRQVVKGSDNVLGTSSEPGALPLDFVLQNWSQGLSRDKYEVVFHGFNTEAPKIIAIDDVQISVANFAEGAEILNQRYAGCVNVVVDRQAKTAIVNKGPKLIFVTSHHVQNSEYVVEGKPSFSMVTDDERRERYFCVYRPEIIQIPWEKRAFLQP